MTGAKQIAGVVVLFNPDPRSINNILSYLPFINKLYIVDNSLQQNSINISKLLKTDKVYYLSLKENAGVAFALNAGASLAIDEGYSWLLMMDQDSIATDNMIPELLLRANEYYNCGIIAPRRITKQPDNSSKTPAACSDVLTTMTSGSIINLAAYKKCGTFIDDFFIDHVDHEYCLRLKTNGFRVIQCNNAILYHSLGEHIELKVIGFNYIVTTHKPFRLYYHTRNGLYVSFKYFAQYPSFTLLFMSQLFKNIFKALFVESCKIERVTMICYGVIDYASHRFGKKLL